MKPKIMSNFFTLLHILNADFFSKTIKVFEKILNQKIKSLGLTDCKKFEQTYSSLHYNN
jgi:hypothetical protein